jgi:hypothetical protein
MVERRARIKRHIYKTCPIKADATLEFLSNKCHLSFLFLIMLLILKIVKKSFNLSKKYELFQWNLTEFFKFCSGVAYRRLRLHLSIKIGAE